MQQQPPQLFENKNGIVHTKWALRRCVGGALVSVHASLDAGMTVLAAEPGRWNVAFRLDTVYKGGLYLERYVEPHERYNTVPAVVPVRESQTDEARHAG